MKSGNKLKGTKAEENRKDHLQRRSKNERIVIREIANILHRSYTSVSAEIRWVGMWRFLCRHHANFTDPNNNL